MKENRIVLEKPLGFLIILTSSTSKSKKNKKIKPSGGTGILFCRKCKGLLSPPDKEGGLRRCDKCGRSQKSKGEEMIIIISKAPKPRERKIKGEKKKKMLAK